MTFERCRCALCESGEFRDQSINDLRALFVKFHRYETVAEDLRSSWDQMEAARAQRDACVEAARQPLRCSDTCGPVGFKAGTRRCFGCPWRDDGVEKGGNSIFWPRGEWE